MYLHRLVVTGIGPFPDEHVIDLARLGETGLFLLEGPTGSGKSTLIDAIVFALYGKVASVDGSDDRLRSRHCRPDQESVVDLVLETPSGVFRVRRTPAYERARHRGPGTTAQNATAALWRLSSPDRPEGGELIANRAEEVARVLHPAIGLDRDQFVQTIVLPQGEFSRFLRARPEDRTDLLQKVFGTASYERVQEMLERMRAEAKSDVAAAGEALRLAGAGFRAVARPDDAEAAALDLALAGAGEDLSALVTATAEASSATAAARDAEHAAARTARETAVRALEAGARTGQAFARRRELRARLADLMADEPGHRARSERLAAGRRARVVAAGVRGAREARERLAEIEARAEAAAAAVPELHARLDGLTDAADLAATLAGERDRVTGQRAALERLVVLEAELPARRAAAIATGREQEERRRRLAELAADLEVRLPEARTALQDAAREVAAAAGDLPAARIEAATADSRLTAARDVERLTGESEALETAARAAVTRAEAAAATAAERHRARIAGIAAELATALVPGEPCAVCGALEHPAPAARAEGHVGVEEVEAAEAERDEATADLSRLQAERSSLAERLAAAVVAAEGDVPTAEDRVRSCRARVVAAEAAATRAAELAERTAALDEEIRRVTGEHERLAREIAAAGARAESRAEELAEHERAVTEGAGDAATVADRVTGLSAHLAQVTAWHAAAAALAVARDQATEREAEAARALEREGFASFDDATGALLPEGEETALDRLTREHEGELLGVRSGLAEPQMTALPEADEVDLAALEAARDEAMAAEVAAAQAADLARDRAGAVTGAARGVVAAREALVRVREETAPVIRMGNLAGAVDADNTRRLTLGTYVLMRRFQDVVASANDRLQTMSGGRYALQHSEERENGRSRKTGLALRVVDHVTGDERDPRTLSGGETFYVSLCLALGLADVVTGENGGIELGTLFIDEGFGSLDADTLDLVLRELGKLRDRGRVIGVVSHVDVMKSVIGERIEVRRRADGTSTLRVVA